MKQKVNILESGDLFAFRSNQFNQSQLWRVLCAWWWLITYQSFRVSSSINFVIWFNESKIFQHDQRYSFCSNLSLFLRRRRGRMSRNIRLMRMSILTFRHWTVAIVIDKQSQLRIYMLLSSHRLHGDMKNAFEYHEWINVKSYGVKRC